MSTIFQSSWRDVGDARTPQSIKRMRRMVMDACRHVGQPVVLRHRWTPDDVTAGVAKTCPACYVAEYDQVRNDCQICYSTGFVSVENEPTGLIYIDTLGQPTSDPGTGTHAPRFGGFDRPWLTYMIEPDVQQDTFKINEEGVLIRTYDATGTAPWKPRLGDNDLCINVNVDHGGGVVTSAGDRFLLKMVQQLSIRGFGHRASFGPNDQTFLVSQSFEMNKLPSENIMYQLAIDPEDSLGLVQFATPAQEPWWFWARFFRLGEG